MSSAFLNIVIGLVTSIIGGGCVWAWQRVKGASRLRRKERFSGLEPRGTCLIVMNNRAAVYFLKSASAFRPARLGATP